ncbi:uridine kinase family protein [Anaerobacillus isosaccharinicus]|uniref:Phosphoribulokinase n=1 Tax=Anaerobacillus isosaccharinicus TaxID=1532552 RepID=A0A1S2LVB8_9BACI|nr:P-loop NTPase fold protein [Anaerobacillus isosaccharinicus]MBA5588416.1 phosphoribulokinase [Anaerobacillus isosaccharinicus]QOY38153.1 phosphoribulokinase [Anaerobacillus isosaccharinicus]
MEQIIDKVANLISEKNEKIIIGISGHGASGKTTFANNLVKRLENDVNYINTDPYIITDVRKYTVIDYEYQNEKYSYKMTACHPAAHNLIALERDIKMIRANLDFHTIETHYMESTLISSKKNINIVEGMSVAFLNPNLFDLTVYLYTDGETELIRRGVRDVSERMADFNSIKKSHEQRRIQYDLFMHPYHKNFDIVIKNSNEESILQKCVYGN